jgi:hypothetical protein
MSATLAAREALLVRMVAAYDKANPMRRADFHSPVCGCLRCEMDTARMLAAEIAEALKRSNLDVPLKPGEGVAS